MLFLSCGEKTNPWHLAMFMKIPLKMTQNIITSHFAIISPKKIAFVLPSEACISTFSLYASLLSRSYQQPQLLGKRLELGFFICLTWFTPTRFPAYKLLCSAENWIHCQDIVKFTSCFFSCILSKIGLKDKV